VASIPDCPCARCYAAALVGCDLCAAKTHDRSSTCSRADWTALQQGCGRPDRRAAGSWAIGGRDADARGNRQRPMSDVLVARSLFVGSYAVKRDHSSDATVSFSDRTVYGHRRMGSGAHCGSVCSEELFPRHLAYALDRAARHLSSMPPALDGL